MMEGHVLGEAMKTLALEMKTGEEYVATASDVLDRLRDIGERNDVNIYDRSFPRSARALSQFLRRDMEGFERISGLSIKMDDHNRDPVTRRKLMRFRKAEH